MPEPRFNTCGICRPFFDAANRNKERASEMPRHFNYERADRSVRSAPLVEAPDQRRGHCLDEFFRVYKFASDRNSALQKLIILTAERAEAILGFPIESWQPDKPVFVAGTQ